MSSDEKLQTPILSTMLFVILMVYDGSWLYYVVKFWKEWWVQRHLNRLNKELRIVIYDFIFKTKNASEKGWWEKYWNSQFNETMIFLEFSICWNWHKSFTLRFVLHVWSTDRTIFNHIGDYFGVWEFQSNINKWT